MSFKVQRRYDEPLVPVTCNFYLVNGEVYWFLQQHPPPGPQDISIVSWFFSFIKNLWFGFFKDMLELS
jgi:hypothetical protein